MEFASLLPGREEIDRLTAGSLWYYGLCANLENSPNSEHLSRLIPPDSITQTASQSHRRSSAPRRRAARVAPQPTAGRLRECERRHTTRRLTHAQTSLRVGRYERGERARVRERAPNDVRYGEVIYARGSTRGRPGSLGTQ